MEFTALLFSVLEEICLVLRRTFVLLMYLVAIMASGSMLLAQSPGEFPVSTHEDRSISVEKPREAYENEDQKFSIPFGWDVRPGMNDEFRYSGSPAYYSAATKSLPQEAPAIVPEPGTMVLMAAGLAAMAVRRIRIAA